MVINRFAKVRKRARAQIESLYEGVCNVYAYQEVYDKKTRRTKLERQEQPLLENEPCRVSYSGAEPANQTSTVSITGQTITLYVAPEAEIPPGCVVEVEQAGRKSVFASSGQPRVYPTHQEIGLTLEEQKA